MGFFSKDDMAHINILESIAALFGLNKLFADFSHCHLKLLADNTTAVGAINNMSAQNELHKLIIEIWNWAQERQRHIFRED